MENHLNAQQTNHGPSVLPINRIQLYEPNQWEEFIEEWLDLKKTEYVGVERFGGAGDKGRDVVAYITDKKLTNYQWDCYQCKHYDKPLTPTQIYKEIGKILLYTYRKDYPVPKAYYFVAPKGCGTTLSKLLQDAEKLKEEMIANWFSYCRDKITDIGAIELEGDFLNHVNGFDYSIFTKILPKKIIEEHQKHPNHITRFGGGLPSRQKLVESLIPKTIQISESVYVSQLLLAYGSDSAIVFDTIGHLPNDSNYQKHFVRARLNFHHAEQLRNFSRDTLPVGVFESYQEEIFDAVVNITEEDEKNGFQKVKAVETHAGAVTISSNPLKDVSFVKDRQGVCHQLSNDGKIKWV
jgi:hypothetical protein